MKPALTSALFFVTTAFILFGCAKSQTPVEKAQQNLNEIRTEFADNVQRAESRLAEAIAKSDAKISSARRSLDNGTTAATTSGYTTAPPTAGEVSH